MVLRDGELPPWCCCTVGALLLLCGGWFVWLVLLRLCW